MSAETMKKTIKFIRMAIYLLFLTTFAVNLIRFP